MKTLLVAVLSSLLLAAPAAALTQLQAQASYELRQYGYRDVDVTKLSNGQLIQIRHLASSDEGVASIRKRIGSTLRRGLLK